jgi:hypothetical protein
LLLLAWTLAAALFWQPSYTYRINEHGLADERTWYVHGSYTQRPTSLRDYRHHHYFLVGEQMAVMAGRRGLQAVYWAHIGIAPAVLPASLTVIDPLGLNDWLGSRIELRQRGRPGHEKIALPAWFLARYPPGQGMIVRQQLAGALNRSPTEEELAAARRVLDSPAIAELHEAVTAPMTPRLFLRNLGRAFRLSRLRIPPDPLEAAERFVRPAR